MRVSIPAALLITLFAHRYLSHALPLGPRLRSPAPRALDYPVVDVADPEVSGPDLAPGDDDDEVDEDDIVTRTVTRESGAPTATSSELPSESCTTGGVVSVVGVKETGGAVRSTVTTYTTRSTREASTSVPTPSPSTSPGRSAGAAHAPDSTSGASVSEPTPSSTEPTSSAKPTMPSAASSVSSSASTNSLNGTSPIITPSPTTEAPSGGYSSSTPSTVTEDSWPLPAVFLDPEAELGPGPTTSATTWSTTFTPAPYEEGYNVSTGVSTASAPLSTSSSDAPSYDEPNHGGFPSWNGTIAYNETAVYRSRRGA